MKKRGNKPEPTPEPQQPPENSNWKLITDKYIPIDTGWYIMIHRASTVDTWLLEKVNSSKFFGNVTVDFGFPTGIIYKWELNNEPMDSQLPTINKNTGKITDWKG